MTVSSVFSIVALPFMYSDILRARSSESTRSIDEHNVRATMMTGSLVSDSLANELIMKEMNGKGSDSPYCGYLLDGYPRTLSQARFLHQHIVDKGDALKFASIHITLDRGVAVTKLLGRRICQTCGGNFNIASVMDGGFDMPAMLPDPQTCKLQGRCDPRLTRRSDDTEHTILKRIELYSEQNQSILDFYSQLHVLRSFEVKKGVRDAGDLIRLIEQSY